MIGPPPRSTLFPSPTLFRSLPIRAERQHFRPLSGSESSSVVGRPYPHRSEEHTSELQSHFHLLYPLFFNDRPPTEIYPLSLPDALPISTNKSGKATFSTTVRERIQFGCW